VVSLSKFDLSICYPGRWAIQRQAAAALRWSGRVRDVCRAILGAHPPRRRSP
jgi:hypothetical protein